MNAPPDPTSTALSIRGLTKSYGSFHLGPLDIDLEPGMVLAFVGPNGAGKTTTLHCALGLVRADAGTTHVFGQPADPEQPSWKQDVGFVGEVQGFYRNWTVAENLRFVSKFYERWDDTRVERLAHRLDLPLDKRAADLSRGGRTKMGLVAALAHDPRLLILDEPTNALDPVVRSEALDILWEIMEDGEHAIFYSTHVLSDISRLADELLFLRQGHDIRRTSKEALTETWRRISCRLEAAPEGSDQVAGGHRIRRSGDELEVISSDHEATLADLRDQGAQQVQTTRLTLDEIAVEILKEGHRVASA